MAKNSPTVRAPTDSIEDDTLCDWTPPSTAVDCGTSEKVSERSKSASSFRAAGREEHREPAGWCPGANGFGDFCRNKSHSGARRRAHKYVNRCRKFFRRKMISDTFRTICYQRRFSILVCSLDTSLPLDSRLRGNDGKPTRLICGLQKPGPHEKDHSSNNHSPAVRAPTCRSKQTDRKAIQHPTQITKTPSSCRKRKNCGNFPKH